MNGIDINVHLLHEINSSKNIDFHEIIKRITKITPKQLDFFNPTCISLLSSPSDGTLNGDPCQG